MTKKTTPQPDVWGSTTPDIVTSEEVLDLDLSPPMKLEPLEAVYDLDGLMTDFPTAGELQKFVYDQTGIALNLKGRANKMKYQVAMDVLNGVEVAPAFLSNENPYLDKNDLVPEEPVRILPERDPYLPPKGDVQNTFHCMTIPHPDQNQRAMDKKVTVCFRKYNNGVITYEIEGPMTQISKGEKIDKYGRTRPEIIVWVDPRSPEQLIVRADGSITPTGQKVRALMQSMRVNDSNIWDTWIDREFISINQSAIENPWS